MTDAKLLDALETLGRALDRLREAVETPLDEHALVIDATIQRFEFTIELFWKTLKKFLEAEGKEAKSPRESLKQAYALGWISAEQFWLDMLVDRNLSSHTYNEEQASLIYSRIKNYYPKILEVFDMLKRKREN